MKKKEKIETIEEKTIRKYKALDLAIYHLEKALEKLKEI
jgi:ribosome-associated translation inhibitor RaiA